MKNYHKIRISERCNKWGHKIYRVYIECVVGQFDASFGNKRDASKWAKIKGKELDIPVVEQIIKEKDC